MRARSPSSPRAAPRGRGGRACRPSRAGTPPRPFRRCPRPAPPPPVRGRPGSGRGSCSTRTRARVRRRAPEAHRPGPVRSTMLPRPSPSAEGPCRGRARGCERLDVQRRSRARTTPLRPRHRRPSHSSIPVTLIGRDRFPGISRGHQPDTRARPERTRIEIESRECVGMSSASPQKPGISSAGPNTPARPPRFIATPRFTYPSAGPSGARASPDAGAGTPRWSR